MSEPHDLLLPADAAPALLTMAGGDALHGDLPHPEPPEEPKEGLLHERPEEGSHEALEPAAEERLQEPTLARAEAPVQEEGREPAQGAAQEADMQAPAQELAADAEGDADTDADTDADADADAEAEAVEVGFRKVFRAVQRALQMASYLPAEPPGLTRVAVVSRQGRLIASAALDSPSQARFLLDQLQALGFEERSSTEEIQKLGCDLLVVHTANLEVGQVQGIVKGLKGERWPPEG